MKFKILLIATAIGMSVASQAQSDVDALRYSQIHFGGTARSMGAGGAFGALGGDFSSLSTNPAGLGIYRSSELIFSPGLMNINSETNFYGTGLDASKQNLHLSNIGMVFNKKSKFKDGNNSRSGWVATNFAIGHNRLANFNSEVTYTGFNPHSSITDHYIDRIRANGGVNPSDMFNFDPFGVGLAWETYLLNPTASDTTDYYSEIYDGVQQSKRIKTKGGHDEIVVSLAANFSNKFFIGGTVGLPRIRYEEEHTYSEEDMNGTMSNFNTMDLTNEFKTKGQGLNFKLGVIYRPVDFLRIGGAIHSPTLLSMRDRFSSSMETSLDTSGFFQWDSPRGEFEYQLVTPWRATMSAASVSYTHLTLPTMMSV